MARQLLVVGLKESTSIDDARRLKAMLFEQCPDLETLLIVGCTSLVVVDLPDADGEAEEVSQLQRGREIQADLDVYHGAGGRSKVRKP